MDVLAMCILCWCGVVSLFELIFIFWDTLFIFSFVGRIGHFVSVYSSVLYLQHVIK